MNVVINFCILFILMILIYILYKKLDKLGLLIAITITNILSFILSFKYMTLSALTININSVAYISSLSVLYLYYEKTNKKETNKLINEIFILNIITAILLAISSLYIQTINDTIGINMKNVFIYNYRVLIAYPITSLLSYYGMIYIYNKIKEIYDNMFISTTVSFLSIGLLDIILFTLISYLLKFNIKSLVDLILSTYMFRILLTVVFSFFLTLVLKKKKVRKWIQLI